jgi:hypothetical protein
MKLVVRSVKESGWIGSKESNRSRGFCGNLQDTKEKTKITGYSRGLNAKLPRASSSSVQGRTGRGRRPVRPKSPVLRRPRSSSESQNWKRGSRGSRRQWSPWAEIDGADRICRSTRNSRLGWAPAGRREASSCAGRRLRARSAARAGAGGGSLLLWGARGSALPRAAAAMPAWPMGLAAGPERVGSGPWARPNPVERFFFEFSFNAKTNSRKV